LSGLIVGALNGLPKEEILNHNYFLSFPFVKSALTDFTSNSFEIIMGVYKTKTENEIKSTGYVIHTLEAALWSFYTTDTFEDGLVKAVNLGDDADTTGAVYGQLAGAYYGINGIPKRWLDKIVLPDIIIDVADKLLEKRKL
jgi:hypothetical protein